MLILIVANKRTDYVSNLEIKEYSQNVIRRYKVFNTEGYVDEKGNYYYYRRDHLGNNREVWKPSGGSTLTVQRTRYYPSGLPWEYQAGDSASLQPYKYGSKEFMEMHGLDMYDSHARWYDPRIIRTTSPDPLAEKYYDISPYAWCGNNPVNAVDPDGRDWIVVNNTYQFEWRDDIIANSTIPDGYTYVGAENNDILSFMGIETSYPVKSSNIAGFVASDAELGSHAVTHAVNIKSQTTLEISANVFNQKSQVSENNTSGKTFNGINVNVKNISSNTPVDGKMQTGSIMTVRHGKHTGEFVLKSPSYTSIQAANSTVTEAGALIPAHIITPNISMSVSVKGNWWVTRYKIL